MTPLNPKHADEPALFFIPLLDQEFDEAEEESLLLLERIYH
jgi:hypothetical protein